MDKGEIFVIKLLFLALALVVLGILIGLSIN